MKREKLRRRLALATLEVLGPFHKRTIPNVKRYVLKHLPSYKIRKTEKISEADITHGILICEFICMQKPIAFAYGIGQRFTDARKEAFMNTPLPVK